MEFYEDTSVRLNAIVRRIDMDDNYAADNTEEVEPQADKFGFTGGVTRTVLDSTLPIEVLREREQKWLKMTKNWNKWMTKSFPKVKERCRKGIPPAMRGLAWQHLSGSKKLKDENEGVFGNLLTKSSEWESTIVKDLDRTFPFHDRFAEKEGSGQQDLFQILKAYAVYNEEVGYCQAMAPVTAVLLMHMTTEDAFWCLVSLLEDYVKGYYGMKLETIRVESDIFGGLLSTVLPSISKHMKLHNIDPLMYMTEWFMCLFARNLPFASVLRIWDMFFCEGVKVLHRTALTILKITLTPEVLKTCEGIFETNNKLRNLTPELMHEDTLIPAILNLELTRKQIEKEHRNKNQTLVVR